MRVTRYLVLSYSALGTRRVGAMGFVIFCIVVFFLIHALYITNRVSGLEEKVNELLRERQRAHSPTLKERIAQGQPEAAPEPATSRTTLVDEPVVPKVEVTPPPPPVAVTTTPVVEARTGVPEPEPNDWNAGDFFRRIHLLPPRDAGGTTEVRLASWWATRVGILLGVIAAVFFGVYVSKNASPAIRLMELSGVAVGMVILGLRLERNMAAFGRVITAGGLAMLYVSAFGAHAFSPMKVTDSPALGLVLQLLGAGLVFGFSLWKRSEALSTMAVLLGLVSCWFSHAYGLQPFPLIGLVLFAAIGSGLFIWKRWLAPMAVAFAGSYFGYAMLIAFDWRFTQGPGWPALLGSILLLLAVFHVGVRNGRRGDVLNPRWRTFGALLNAWVGMLAGGVAIWILEPRAWGWFCLAMGLMLLVFCVEEYLGPRLEGIWVPLFLFAASAFALFFFDRLSGSPRWMALALLASTVLIAMHYTRSVWLERFFFLFWLVAVGSFLTGLNWASGSWMTDYPRKAAGVSFLLIQTCTLSVYRRFVLTFDAPRRVPRYRWTAWMALGAGLLLFLQLLSFNLMDICISIGVAAAVALLAPALRAWPPLVVSAVALVLLPLNYMFYADNEVWWHYLAGVGLLAAGLTAAELLQRRYRPELGYLPLYRLLAMLQAAVVFAILLFARTDDESWKQSGLLEQAGWAVLAAALVGYHAMRRTGSPETEAVVVLRHLYAPIVSAFLVVALSTVESLSVAWAGAGAIFFLACFLARNSAPVTGGALLFLPAYLGHLLMPRPEAMTEPFWHDPFMVLLALGIAIVHHLRVPRGAWFFSPAADFILHAFWMAALVNWFTRVMVLEWVLPAGAGVTLAVYLISTRFPFRYLRAASLVPAIWSLLLTIPVWDRLPATPPWVASVLLLATWLTHRIVAGNRDDEMHWFLGLLTAGLALFANDASFRMPWELLSLSALGLIFIGLWRVAGMRAAGLLGAAVLAWDALRLLQLRVESAPGLESLLATAGAVLAILAAGLIVAASHWDRFVEPRLRLAAAWGFPVTALVLAFLAFAWPGTPAYEYATPWWGLTGIGIFAAGLCFRLRAWRIVGLAGLALCVGRVFLIDLQETFYRIVAFGAVAALLLAIGYLYTRFREFIERGEV